VSSHLALTLSGRIVNRADQGRRAAEGRRLRARSPPTRATTSPTTEMTSRTGSTAAGVPEHVLPKGSPSACAEWPPPPRRRACRLEGRGDSRRRLLLHGRRLFLHRGRCSLHGLRMFLCRGCRGLRGLGGAFRRRGRLLGAELDAEVSDVTSRARLSPRRAGARSQWFSGGGWLRPSCKALMPADGRSLRRRRRVAALVDGGGPR
jgi:hypothetical protein